MRKPFGEMKNPFLEGFLFVFISPFYLFSNLFDLWRGKRVWENTESTPVVHLNTQAEAMQMTMARFLNTIKQAEKEMTDGAQKK